MSDLFPAVTPHYNQRRPTMIVIHGTEVPDSVARQVLEGKTPLESSCHYYINATGDVVQYLDETARAWHAGQSFWNGFTDINSLSIGIELEAISHSRKFDGTETVYTKAQMDALVPLLSDIQTRHKIAPWNIVAHQDISCTRPFEPVPAENLNDILAYQPVGQQRKYDPGVVFDWQILADNGIGLWHGLAPVEQDAEVIDNERLAMFYMNMAVYGYDMRHLPGYHDHTSVIRAFQTHFLPWNICGKVTEQSLDAIQALVRLKLEMPSP